jgi:4-amino-4-deoxy-L-arabinose transferase-like glycosyltransferase
MNASPLIIKTGEPIMALGGFSGSDKVLTNQQLAELVKNKTVRYFLMGGGMGGQQANSWVTQSCTAVNSQLWSGSGSGQNSGTLYDCAGGS